MLKLPSLLLFLRGSCFLSKLRILCVLQRISEAAGPHGAAMLGAGQQGASWGRGVLTEEEGMGRNHEEQLGHK